MHKIKQQHANEVQVKSVPVFSFRLGEEVTPEAVVKATHITENTKICHILIIRYALQPDKNEIGQNSAELRPTLSEDTGNCWPGYQLSLDCC